MMPLWMTLAVLTQLPSGHPQVAAEKAPRSAEDVIAALDKDPSLRAAPKPFAIGAAMGRLYYGVGRWNDAAGLFRSALASAKKESKVQPGDISEVQALLGNALFLAGDVKGALALHDQVLARTSDAAEHLYARAAISIEQGGAANAERARKDLKRLLAYAPQSARAESARGLLAALDGQPPPAAASTPPVLTPEVVAAFQNTERTPAKQAEWDGIIGAGESALAKGECQAALDQYKRVMPYLPDNGRVRAGMAWSLVCLQREPMAQRVWGVAVSSDPGAVEKLGDVLAAQGNKTSAQALYAKLSESAPDYAAQSGLSRKRTP